MSAKPMQIEHCSPLPVQNSLVPSIGPTIAPSTSPSTSYAGTTQCTSSALTYSAGTTTLFSSRSGRSRSGARLAADALFGGGTAPVDFSKA